jgi:hypothetical protein
LHFNRNHDHSHDFIEIVIFTLFQACVTFKSALLYILFTKTHKKAIVRHISFILIILSHYTMKDIINTYWLNLPGYDAVANYWKITVVNVLGMCITLHVLNFFQPFHSNIYIIITKIITNDWLVCFIFHGVMGENNSGNMPNYCLFVGFREKNVYKRADLKLHKLETGWK